MSEKTDFPTGPKFKLRLVLAALIYSGVTMLMLGGVVHMVQKHNMAWTILTIVELTVFVLVGAFMFGWSSDA